MKKILLLVTFMVCAIGYSQDNTTTDSNGQKPTNLFGKNEFKVNALYFVLGAAEFQYERILNEESSVGARILFTYDKDVFTQEPFFIDGFYRFYFGKKPAAGFFVEGLASYNAREYETYIQGSNFGGSQYKVSRESGVGLGLQVGGKFVTRRGLLFEINGGIGRNISQSGNLNSEDKIFGRFAISAGYRF